MSKKQEFIDYVRNLINENPVEMSDYVKMYWDAFCGTDAGEKPMFTDNGKQIMVFLQEHTDTPMWRAKDIAEEIFLSSRAVSGSMRKLVSDGFIEKVGQDPVNYSLTEKGKNIKSD